MKGKWLTPVVTAFDRNGNIDYKANKKIYDYLIENGMDGIVIMGSTGEFFAMTKEQRKDLIKFAIQYINNRTKVYVGTGSMTIGDTIELSNYAYDIGADAVMVISPYYFSLSKESIELFYDKVAKSTKANIYIYNFPERTGYDITPEITLNLVRKHENIVGYKDTVTEMGHTRALINTVCNEFPNFEVYSGYDEYFAHNVFSGGAGAIGGLSNIIPDICAEWVKAINEKDFEETTKIQKTIDNMMAIYNIGTPFIPIVKKAMILRGIEMEDYCKPPLIQANENQTLQISKLLQKLISNK